MYGVADHLSLHRYLKYAKVFGPLIAMVLAIVITASARLDKHGIKIVGKIPRGLPPVTVNRQCPLLPFYSLLPTQQALNHLILCQSPPIPCIVGFKDLSVSHSYLDLSTKRQKRQILWQ